MPRIIQIAGYDEEMLAEAAECAERQGAAIVDINMGCPAKKVCRRLAGSSLLRDPPLVRRILKRVVERVIDDVHVLGIVLEVEELGL